jgi:hypothetical protein
LPSLVSTQLGLQNYRFGTAPSKSISWIVISEGLREHIGKLLLAGVENQDLAKGESQVYNQPASTSFSNAAWINSRMIRVAPAMRCARSPALLMVSAGVFYPISSVRQMSTSSFDNGAANHERRSAPCSTKNPQCCI